MPRIAIIIMLALFSTDALAASCGKRVMAFNSYEDYDDKMNKEIGVSVFPVSEFGPHTSFEGLLVSNRERPESELEIEVRKTPRGEALRTKKLSLGEWQFSKPYFVAKDFTPSEFLGFEEGFFVLRLVLEGKTLCEDRPRAIEQGD